MQLFLSTESLSRVGSSEISFRRGDVLPIEVSFLADGKVTELPAAAVGQLAIKSAPDGAFLALTNSWTKTGIGMEAVYVFDLNLNTQELATALNRVDAIRALMEIEWVVGSYRYSSNSIPVIISETLIGGDNPPPVETIDLKSTEQEAVAGTVNNRWMTPLGTMQAIVARLGNVDNTADSVKPVSTPQAAALAGKANTSHQHVVSDITGLQSALDGKASSNHAHQTGKTIYVDSGVGTDTRTSLSQYSINAPFATIAAAVTASAIGDLIYVRAGNHAISGTISLNGEGNLYFEQGTTVTVAANVVAFSLTANEPKAIGGYGIFTLSGTGGLWSQSGGNTTLQQVAIEFASITNLAGAGTVFAAASGILVINSRGVVTAPASTVVSETGTSGQVFYQVLFTYCGKLSDMTQANSTMQLTALCWTVQIFGTEGLSIVGGTTSLRIENLVGGGNPATKLVVFKFANGDATTNSHVFRGGRLIANSTNPCITFNSTTATNKVVKLMGDTQLNTGATNCIVSADTRDVFVSSAHSNVAADTNTTIRPSGKLSVDPYFAF
jgi:hypothetical protein